MKIAQVCPYAWHTRGGVQTHVASLTTHLRARGHHVLVVAPGERGEAAPAEDEHLHLTGSYTRVPFNGSVAPIALQPRAWLQVRRVLRRFDPDVIHVHEPRAPSLALAALLFARAPVVATFHAYYPPSINAALYDGIAFVVRPLGRDIAVKLAVSRSAAACAAPWVYGGVQIVPNGVDLARFTAAAPMALPRGRKLLFLNRLDRRKGIEVAFRAFSALAVRHSDLQLVIAGDGPCRGALRELPASVSGRVTMLGDVPADRLPSVYAAADLFLAPAYGHESFGIVLLEAMAAGLPIVASDIPGYREVLRHGESAWLVPPRDVQAVVEAVTRVLASRRLSARLAAGGRRRVSSFAWDVVVTDLERCYARAVREGRWARPAPVPAGSSAREVGRSAGAPLGAGQVARSLAPDVTT
jgi:phosphatidylinositol alpha-mannosyltransferase